MNVRQVRAALNWLTPLLLVGIFVQCSVVDLLGWQVPGVLGLDDKHSFFNLYVLKMGWAWTMAAWVLPLLFSSSYVSLPSSWRGESARSAKQSQWLQRGLRIVLSTLVWITCVTTFDFIQEMTGSCSNAAYDSASACTRNGHEWSGIDISGHCFLIVFSSLVLWEESCSSLLKVNAATAAEVVEAGVLALRLTWFLGYWATITYFHTFFDKAMGSFLAFVAFGVTQAVAGNLQRKYLQ